MFRDHFEFFRQFRAHFHTTGAVAPSSRFLARAMTQPLGTHAPGGTVRPSRVLEVGPGTGAVTRRIVKLLRPDDQLDLVELNEAFAGLLRERFEWDPHYRGAADRSRVHVCGIESFQADQPYDYIISGLPFNNFSPEFVEQVLAAFFQLLRAGGVVSYFEYMYVRPLRVMVSGSTERDRLRGLSSVMDAFLAQHRFRRDWVFLNVPPAWVQHLRKS